MKHAALAVLVFLAGVAAEAHSAVAVEFVNASKPTRCAEEDNIYVKVLGAGITAFQIRAEHPPYIGAVRKDSTAPDLAVAICRRIRAFPRRRAG